jgi:hypothetical protein
VSGVKKNLMGKIVKKVDKLISLFYNITIYRKEECV